MKTLIATILSLSLMPLTGCSDRTEAKDAGGTPKVGQHDEHASHDPAAEAAEAAAAADPSRIAIPESVRQNLGLTFAKVERRRVGATMRLPGRFERLPSARREYSAVLPGRVELLVQQYQAVEAGAPLCRIQSPEWLKLRQQLHEERLSAGKAEADLAVAQATKSEAEQALAILQKRVEALAESGTRKAELEADLASRKASLPRLEAEVRAKQAELQAAQQRFPMTLASAASLLGTTSQAMMEEVQAPNGPKPRWSIIEFIEVKAAQAGVVETLTVSNGSWMEANKAILTTVDPQAVRFRAVGLQADLGKLRDGLPASIIAGPGKTDLKPIAGKLTLGLEADADSRTLQLIVTPQKPADWARADVSAFAEVMLDDSEDPELAIPVAAVIQDELTKVFFRRDPKDPDQVIRVEADLGASDGHWIVVNSGAKASDEIVVDGVYELKLASSAKGGGTPKGHFHADGSFHEGKDKK